METPTLAELWAIYPLLQKARFEASKQVGISPLQAQLLSNREISKPEEMQHFLRARYDETLDPFALPDMARAVARIQEAFSKNEHITVYGDYDADGVTSSALLFLALSRLKQAETPLDFHIPHRLNDGCGLNLTALDQLKARGTSLIITTDCASSDVEQVEYARTLGIDVIITDHHQPPATRPAAYAMINPWRADSTYPERYLCGAGIAFKLVQALYRTFDLSAEAEMELLDFVAIGTVADLAGLLGENHTFARIGLERLKNTKWPGLRALIQSAGLQAGRVRERDISFLLAPRINAAGRMKHASIAFQLMTTDDVEEANTLVKELDELNQSRKQLTEILVQEARAQAQGQSKLPIILVSGEDWHEGLIGLVAGKLSEEVRKPVLVLSSNATTKLSRGSARGPRPFNLIRALQGFTGSLERFGGHSQAAGFTIRNELVGDLHQYLQNWKAESVPELTVEEETVSRAQMIDLVFTKFELLNYATFEQISQLRPFGASNPEPTFRMGGIELLEMWTTGWNRQNLRLRLACGEQQILGTMVKGANQRQRLATSKKVNIIFQIDGNDDERSPDLWLKVLAIEPSR